MPRQGCTAKFCLAGSLVLLATVSAQTSSIEGNVTGADGRPSKGVKIRFEQKVGGSPVIHETDINGRYTAALPRGIYKMSLAEHGTVRASITVKATGANSRIDFDLRPSAPKKITHYVWIGGETGSHLPGHWVEAGIRAAPSRTP
jgi:hypothetical protein